MASRGDDWYDNHIRPVVETDENISKMLILDIITGDYEIDEMQNSHALNTRMLANDWQAIASAMMQSGRSAVIVPY